MFVCEWHKSMAPEGFSKTVDFKDETVRRPGLERTWMYSQRVFESPSEAMATESFDRNLSAADRQVGVICWFG